MIIREDIISTLPSEAKNIFIAYSGGIDSHVLLHLITTSPLLKTKIIAVYVNHGLQQEANQWALHCKDVSIALGIELQCIQVHVKKTSRKSLEEAAREARYSAFKALLGKNDVILLAQHREDQVETVLLQLFRGAGVRGLSGMPLSNVFGEGRMLRPLLDVSKQHIIDYAKEHKLQWVEDSSNQCDDFDRNFLRNTILPQLKQRWPALDKTVARSARHCAGSHLILQELTKQWFDDVFDKEDQSLIISQLLSLEENKQYLIVRHWFEYLKHRMPSEKRVDEILNKVIKARISTNPKIQGQGYCIKRYKNKVYCLKQGYDIQPMSDKNWPLRLDKLELNADVSLTKSHYYEGIPKKLWNDSRVDVKFRQGGERIRLPGRKGHHSLKNLFQEKAIPPWERSHIPLIYLDDKLAAIADLWVSADFYSVKKEECYQVSWLKDEK